MHRATSSLIFLLLANISVIVMAVTYRWPLSDMLWVYWLQSLIIGVFQAAKMAGLKRFSTENLAINNKPAQATRETKIGIVVFFLFHYGFFHFLYAIFLFQFFRAPAWQAVLPSSGIFLVNHALSFYVNSERDKNKIFNLGQLMFFPYIRIVPMHVVLIVSALLPATMPLLVFFSLLKTAADAVTHSIEHRGS